MTSTTMIILMLVTFLVVVLVFGSHCTLSTEHLHRSRISGS